MSSCVILGSAFDVPELAGRRLTPESVATPFGPVTLHRVDGPRPVYALFRHGTPHRYLPHQIPYRAHAAALQAVGCRALLITSSVGVLNPRLPLFAPLLGLDLSMTENRLPDGSACTMFVEPGGEQGHLVCGGEMFSAVLSDAVAAHADGVVPRVVFAYVGGPRTKTPAENRALAATGADVNSMTVGPEAVLACELGIPVAGLFVGHKYSGVAGRDVPEAPEGDELAASLRRSRETTLELAVKFLDDGLTPPSPHRVFRFEPRRER